MQPKGIEQLYASNLGTVYNFNYDLDVVLSGVSGYVMVDSGAEQQDGSRIFSMNNISDISATSSLTENNMTHSPERLIDGDLSTAWVEGVDGEGMGETIRITFDRSYQLKGIKIHAGYQKNSEVYKNNSRPSCIVVMYSDGTSQTHALWDVNEAQELVLYDDIPTEYLEIMIESTYPGGKYEDTAITEIEIY